MRWLSVGNVKGDLIRTFYEEWHTLSNDTRSTEQALIDRDTFALEYIDGSQRVLEIGCGTGTVLAHTKAERRCGVDISQHAVSLVREKGLEAYQVDIDREDLPFPERDFTGVLCIEVLEHLFDPVHALAEANRVLTDGGRLCVTVPNIGCWHYRLLHLLGTFTDLHGNGLIVDEHIRFYTRQSLSKILGLCGFQVLRVRGAAKRPVKGPAKGAVPARRAAAEPERGRLGMIGKIRRVLRRNSPLMLAITYTKALLDRLGLWRVYPSLFATGLVFECRKVRESPYRYNSPVNHAHRSDSELQLNVNQSG